jgi:hypothetical protein
VFPLHQFDPIWRVMPVTFGGGTTAGGRAILPGHAVASVTPIKTLAALAAALTDHHGFDDALMSFKRNHAGNDGAVPIAVTWTKRNASDGSPMSLRSGHRERRW